MNAVNPTWYKTPLGYLDMDDWLDIHALRSGDDDGWDQVKYDAYELLISGEIDRGENGVLIGMMKSTLSGFFRDTLTNSQHEAVQLVKEAHEKGIPPHKITGYIADVRGTGIRAAQRLLKRAGGVLEYSNKSKMFALGSNFDSNNRGTKNHLFDFDEEEVQKRMVAIQVPCAGASRNCSGEATAKHCLCPSCEMEYGVKPSSRPEPINDMVKRLKNNARRRAQELLYIEKYGVNIDVSEVS